MNDDVRGVDANLLLALHALLEERNLTHAAARIAMSQTAVGTALGRLRTHFDDELLIRRGRDFELTELADRLRPLAATAVESAEGLLGAARKFEPARSTKQFSVSLSEYAMTILAEPLARAVQSKAPHCTISFDTIPPRREQFERALTRRDLVVVPLGFHFPGQFQPLFTDQVVCLVARKNPFVVDGHLTLAALQEMPHAVAQFGATSHLERPPEVLATEIDLGQRRVQVMVTSLLTLPFAISGTDLCAFVPSRLALRCIDFLDLAVVTTPLSPAAITEAAHWHPRRTDEPSSVWLRDLLHEVAIELEDDLEIQSERLRHALR